MDVVQGQGRFYGPFPAPHAASAHFVLLISLFCMSSNEESAEVMLCSVPTVLIATATLGMDRPSRSWVFILAAIGIPRYNDWSCSPRYEGTRIEARVTCEVQHRSILHKRQHDFGG